MKKTINIDEITINIDEMTIDSLEKTKEIGMKDSAKSKLAVKHYARMTMRGYARAVEFFFLDARRVREHS